MGNIQYRYDTPTGYVRPVAIDYSNYYANGGPKRKHDQSYNTVLTPEQEVQYRQWVNTLPVYLRNDYDYDLRGAWLDGVEPDEQQHMPDTYKKPWHPTFSDESIYSSQQMQGGHWSGENFTPSAFNGYMQGMSKYVNYGRNLFAKGGKKPDWDPENPYHVHTEDGQKVGFTPEAYAALPENIKRQVDEHAAAMNTFENQYMVNPEYEEFRKRMEAARMAENVAASRGEYWDRNWYDPNYKSGAYAFDDNGLMTYQGHTYAPFGDSSQQGIVVPMRTPNGMSYGANVAYYPVNVPQQYIERPVQEVNNTINEEQVKAALNKAYTNYIIKNTTKKVLYPRYGTDNYGSKHIQNIYNGDGKLKYNTPYVHKKDSEYYAVFVDDLDEEDRQRGLVGVDYYPMSTIGQYTNKPINVSGKYGLSVDISNIGTEDKKGALHPANSYTKELFPIQYIETKPSEEEAKRNVQVTVDDFSYLGNTFAKGGPIHIKPENRGKFSEAAKRAGYSTQAYARHIMANKENYSPTLVKRANFARNAASWHAYGGNLFADGGPDDPPAGGVVIQPVNFMSQIHQPLTRGQGSVMASDNTRTPVQTRVATEKASEEAQIKRENYMNSQAEGPSRMAEMQYPSMNDIGKAAMETNNADFVDNTRGETGMQPVAPVIPMITSGGLVYNIPYIGAALMYGYGIKGAKNFKKAGERGVRFADYVKSGEGLMSMLDMMPIVNSAGTFRRRLANNVYRYLKPQGYNKETFGQFAKAAGNTLSDNRMHDYVRHDNYFPKNFIPERDEVFRSWLGIPQRSNIPTIYRDIVASDRIPKELLVGQKRKRVIDKTIDWDKMYARTYAIAGSWDKNKNVHYVHPKKYVEEFNIASQPYNRKVVNEVVKNEAENALRRSFETKRDFVLNAHANVNTFVDKDGRRFVQDVWDVNPMTKYIKDWNPRTSFGKYVNNKIWNADLGFVFPGSKPVNVIMEVPK